MAGVAGYTGAILNYIIGAGGVPTGMPAGSNNQNAFILGTAAAYITSTLARRDVNMYSNLGTGGASFLTRKGVPSNIAFAAIIGPQPAFVPNRNGFNNATSTSPY